MDPVVLTPGQLTLEQFIDVARHRRPVEIAPGCLAEVRASRECVEAIIRDGRIAYGINTGFGALKDRTISSEHLETLQENLVVSHAVGLGPALPADTVRGMIFLRLASLALGASGVREEVLFALRDLLNRGVHPVVPRDGSVGASGDLAPLAHVALVLIGRGVAELGGEVVGAAQALSKAGMSPLRLQAKEGLALTNGTQLMTAYAALLYDRLESLCRVADLVAAMSIEAGIGTRVSCDPRIHALRPHAGQMASAEAIWRHLEDSGILVAHKDCAKVQDQYSFRCTPQVHGSVRQGLFEKQPTVLVEMNAATDNPVVLADGDVLSGGNFHGGPIARVLAELGPMSAALGSISEKRTEYLLDPKMPNGLPAFLVDDPLSSGFMLPQYAQAAYVAENVKLSTPVANLTGLSTSAHQEDHVSMGPIDGKYAFTILENVERILGIELLCAAQALDLQSRRLQARPAKATASARDRLRNAGVPFIEHDEELKPHIDRAVELVRTRGLA